MDIDAYLSDFEDAYISAMLWSGHDGDTPLDAEHDNDDLADDLRARVHEDCEKFVTSVQEYLEPYGKPHLWWPSEQAGHDFALTRNHHGAGFWDRTLGTHITREALTYAAHQMGEQSWYIGEDGLIHGE